MLRRFRFTFGVLAASLTLLATSVVLQGAASPSGAQGADPVAPVATAASAPIDLDTTQSSLRQQQAALAAELDVLQATADEVSRAIVALDANVAAQQESTNQAVTAANAARAGEAAAAAKVAEAQFEVDRIETMLRGMAVNLYVRPPVDDAVHAVINASPNDAPVRFALARYRVESVTDVLRAAEAARDELAKAEELAAAATEQAEQAERAEQRKLADLQAARDQQRAFATEVNDRIDRDLFEATMLAEQDAELSARIQAEELALAAQLRDSLARGEAVTIVVPVEPTTTVPPAPEPEPAPTTVVDTPAIDPSSQPGPPPATTVPPPPPPPPPTAPATTAPPPPTTTPVTRTIVITPVTTTWVRGIEVSVAIAANTEAMLAAAERDGLLLTGSGYRNILDQIEIRREVCGPTDYDIWEKPSYECSPPVAIPGRSNHEKGVAIDFSGANGDLIRTRDHPAFQWLAGHAHLYGFFNLPSEPWHWSIDGR